MKLTPKTIVALGLLAVGIALGVLALLQARRGPFFAATAVVQVERDRMDLPQLAELPQLQALVAAEVGNTYFIQTEIALVQSEATLGPVIEELNLNEVWGQRGQGTRLKSAYTLSLLKERVQAQPTGDGTAIGIRATSEQAQEAVALANATARAYCDYRAAHRRRLAQTALDALDAQHAEMQTNLALATEKLQQAEQRLDPKARERLAQPPSEAPADPVKPLRVRHSESVLRFMTRSNQLAGYQRQAAAADENLAQLKASLEQAVAEMNAAEAAVREELTRQQAVREYESARAALEEQNQLFAPVQRTVERLRADLRPQSTAPARIAEAADTAVPADRPRSPGLAALVAGSGVALLLGFWLLVIGPRRPMPA